MCLYARIHVNYPRVSLIDLSDLWETRSRSVSLDSQLESYHKLMINSHKRGNRQPQQPLTHQEQNPTNGPPSYRNVQVQHQTASYLTPSGSGTASNEAKRFSFVPTSAPASGAQTESKNYSLIMTPSSSTGTASNESNRFCSIQTPSIPASCATNIDAFGDKANPTIHATATSTLTTTDDCAQ